MASWQFAFLFPSFQRQLSPHKALEAFIEFEAVFNGSIRMCVPIDDQGHLMDVGEEVALSKPFDLDLKLYLEKGESFSNEIKSLYLSFSVQYIIGCPNPHISVGWSNRLFDFSPIAFQKNYWKALRMFAKNSNSGYVIIINDPPDNFEDRFIDVHGKRMFDLHVKHGYGLGLKEIWIHSSNESPLPEGADYGNPEQIGDGFERYIFTT